MASGVTGQRAQVPGCRSDLGRYRRGGARAGQGPVGSRPPRPPRPERGASSVLAARGRADGLEGEVEDVGPLYDAVVRVIQLVHRRAVELGRTQTDSTPVR